jgi:phage tail sheath protein FI
MLVFDLTDFNSVLGDAVTQAQSRDTSYAATYWPWVRIIDPATGKHVWTPSSTVIPGVYAFNDKVSAPWFAPAGINRGGLSTVLQAQYKLTQGNRDTLYANNINPIATLPKQGVVVYGQKTLQKAQSALDRVNVRRLMIELKNYIRQIADTIVFEQNTIQTRTSFVSRVNPYLEAIQQKQGLYAYKVVMDDSNNGPAVIDQNQLVGQIYVQPTRTAEFISLDFILLPTGAEFPG